MSALISLFWLRCFGCYLLYVLTWLRPVSFAKWLVFTRTSRLLSRWTLVTVATTGCEAPDAYMCYGCMLDVAVFQTQSTKLRQCRRFWITSFSGVPFSCICNGGYCVCLVEFYYVSSLGRNIMQKQFIGSLKISHVQKLIVDYSKMKKKQHIPWLQNICTDFNT